MKRAAILLLAIALAGCASTREAAREQITRWNYLATGRAPEGWKPKKSLCPDFKRNGWANHPPEKDGCYAPAPKVVRAAH